MSESLLKHDSRNEDKVCNLILFEIKIWALRACLSPICVIKPEFSGIFLMFVKHLKNAADMGKKSRQVTLRKKGKI